MAVQDLQIVLARSGKIHLFEGPIEKVRFSNFESFCKFAELTHGFIKALATNENKKSAVQVAPEKSLMMHPVWEVKRYG